MASKNETSSPSGENRPPYRIEVKPSVHRALRRIDAAQRRRIVSKIEALAADPRPADMEKLSGGDDLYRVRCGDYRIIYQIQDDVLLVVVVRVGHRRDVYRNL